MQYTMGVYFVSRPTLTGAGEHSTVLKFWGGELLIRSPPPSFTVFENSRWKGGTISSPPPYSVIEKSL